MKENDIKNLEIIERLVTNHFFLEEESLKIFKKRIYEPVTDDFYKEIFKNSPDLRIRYKIPEEFLEEFDRGWSLFKKSFVSFYAETQIKYTDYRSNKLSFKGRTLKLKKAILDYYLSHEDYAERIIGIDDFDSGNTEHVDYLEEEIINSLNKVGVFKLPSSGVEIVLSMNFADWFLAASGEKWSSCINLESNFSGSYWTGLPGLVGDPNRAMLYVTDGSRKIYQGIRTDAFNSRTWIMLNSANQLNLVRFFPSEILEVDVIRDATKLPFVKSEGCISKHPIDFLYFKDNKSCFIYIDCSKFAKNMNGKFHIQGTGAGTGHYSYLDKGIFIDGSSIFNFKNGLSHLIEKKVNIGEILNNTCAICGNYIEEQIHIFDEKTMCHSCYKQRVILCNICGAEMWLDYSIKTIHDTRICNICYEQFYVTCNSCEKTELKTKLFYLKDTKKWICIKCLKETEENFEVCDTCRTIFTNAPEGYLLILDNEEVICKTCLTKGIGKKQLFLEFPPDFSDLSINNYVMNDITTTNT